MVKLAPRQFSMTIIMTIFMTILILIIIIIENIIIIISIEIIRSETGAWLHTGIGREINIDLRRVGKTRAALLDIAAIIN